MKTKKRRIPSVFLLTALILAAFPVTAFAAKAAEVKIPVRVELSDETPAQEETYIVKLEARDQAPMPEQDMIKVTGTGIAEFPAIHYTAPGIYCYKVSQQAGTHGRGHYDGTVYYVKVTVTNAEDGGLETAAAVHTDAAMTGEKQDIVFHNTYDAAPQPPKTDTSDTPGTSAKKTADSARTGDTADALLFGILSGISGLFLCLGAVVNVRKRRKERSGQA